MNEQQVSELIVALREQTQAQKEQTAALNLLAESNNALCNLILQTLMEEGEPSELVSDLRPTYLNGKPIG
ncbi:hypothetical protein CLM71_08750 [Serratia sp. MYb239]|uniref:hypothetical protein n=1 Tax=Serratia TaxID=613 RepID=UPI000CF630DF|nr:MULTISPECIES: hypothetical protein [Serratia]AVJ17214.1 hypothetical protein CLM71_08750 [Serratia sp. MYb239]CAI2497001.1 Uncharacterised protein [Serratia ficaria]SQJ21755.1 Uncharacterised protein [Serratia rubidaea]